MGGTIVQPGTRGTDFAGANHDSRAVAPGQLFFALPGERVDGFDFAAQAAAAGAAGIVVSRARGVPAGLRRRRDHRRRRSAARAGRPGARRARRVPRPGRRRHRLERQDHDQGAVRRGAAPAGRRAADRRQPQHRRRPAAHDPVRDRERGGLGAGDGDARARRDRVPGRDRAARTSASSPTSAPRTSSGSARSSEIARAKGELFAGLDADGWAVLPATIR